MVTATISSPQTADRELARRVIAFLASRNVPSLRRLAIDVRGGEVILRGRVNTFYEKQLSALCGRRVAGVVQLIDEIVVDPGPPAAVRAAADMRNRAVA